MLNEFKILFFVKIMSEEKPEVAEGSPVPEGEEQVYR